MSNRFFASQQIVGSQTTLDGPEAHHLLHVMRLAAGAEVTLFDGSGCEFRAKVARSRRSEVDLDILDRAEVDRELPFDLTLGVALPKGDRQRWLVEKAVELGVTRIVPLRTKRGVAQPTASALDRLRRTVIEASKQCGRNRLAEITAPVPCSDFLSPDRSGVVQLLALPGGVSLNEATLASADSAGASIVAIGPEGGFTEEEIETAKRSIWQFVDLGPRILRVETAAVALVAFLGFQRLR